MKRKIVIIGAGFVGSTIGYALMNWGVASEIVLVDIDQERAKGEAMDLNHGVAFVKPVKIRSGDYSECEEADIIIITAGANQKPGESRLDLVKKNTEIFKSIIPEITRYNREAVLLIVTNPVDILTYVVARISDLPTNQIIGSGTVLDTSRFRFLLSEHCSLDPRNIHAYIIGEHGDHEVAAWSLSTVAGVPFENYCQLCKGDCSPENVAQFKEKIYRQVRGLAYEIIKRKKATYYAIGLSTARIVESIVRDENTILTVSSVLQGEYGIDDIALSLPAIVGAGGVKQVLSLELDEKEKEDLLASVDILKGVLKKLDL